MPLKQPSLRTNVLRTLRSSTDPMTEEAIALALSKPVEEVRSVCQALLSGSQIRQEDIMSPCWKGDMGENSNLSHGEREEMGDHRETHVLGKGYVITKNRV